MDPRAELFNRLPLFVQPFVTWLSGIPHQNEKQVIKMSPVGVILIGILFIIVGFLVINLSLQQEIYLLIPEYVIGFSLIASGTRRLDVLIIHQALHSKVYKTKKANEIIAEVLTTVLFRSPYKENRKEHMGHHRSPCDENDVDVAYLKSTSIEYINNRKDLLKKIFLTSVSPRFHMRFTLSRLSSNLIYAKPLYRRFMSWLYALFLLSPCLILGLNYLYSLFLYWLLPLFLGFQMSNFLYTATEHRWWLFSNICVRDSKKRDKLTFARVCCNEAPKNSSLIDWCFWWIKALFMHLPTRLFIVVGDTLQHDLHHIVPQCDWPNSTFERRYYKEKYPDRFEEVWGGITTHLLEGNLVK